ERQSLLHHAHFSAFQPVVGTPLEGHRATPAARELRLYQAEHLLRQYGFEYDELIFGTDGNLPLHDDPKTAWALAHPELFPIEVCRAPYEALVRVPGIGPAAGESLVAARRPSRARRPAEACAVVQEFLGGRPSTWLGRGGSSRWAAGGWRARRGRSSCASSRRASTSPRRRSAPRDRAAPIVDCGNQGGPPR